MSEEPRVIATVVPSTLYRAIVKFVERNSHLNISDFLRDAVREKIEKEAPELLRESVKR